MLALTKRKTKNNKVEESLEAKTKFRMLSSTVQTMAFFLFYSQAIYLTEYGHLGWQVWNLKWMNMTEAEISIYFKSQMEYSWSQICALGKINQIKVTTRDEAVFIFQGVRF